MRLATPTWSCTTHLPSRSTSSPPTSVASSWTLSSSPKPKVATLAPTATSRRKEWPQQRRRRPCPWLHARTVMDVLIRRLMLMRLCDSLLILVHRHLPRSLQQRVSWCSGAPNRPCLVAYESLPNKWMHSCLSTTPQRDSGGRGTQTGSQAIRATL